jgi:hypothetical protein
MAKGKAPSGGKGGGAGALSIGGLAGVGLAAGGIDAIVGSLKGFTDQMERFVAALSPAAVEQMNRAFADLNATIGQALLPAFEVMTDLVRHVGDALSAPMRQLAPIFQQVAEILSDVFMTAIRGVALVLNALMPAFKFLADVAAVLGAVLSGFIEVYAVLQTVLATLYSTIASTLSAFFGFGKLGSIIDGVTTAFREVAKAIVIFIAYLAKSLGALGFLDALAKAFTPQPEEKRVTAAGPTSIKDLQSIGKDLALASFQAQGTFGDDKKKSQEEWLAGIAKSVEDVKNNNDTLSTWLKRLLIEEFLPKLGTEIVKAWNELDIGGRINNAASAAGNNVRGFQNDHPILDILTGGPGRRLLGLPI